jgi:aminopeptidase N
MKKILGFVFTLTLLMSLNSAEKNQNDLVQTGVPLSLARWRAAHYGNVRYKLSVTLEKGAPLMKGEIEIRVTLDEEGAKNHLILDWRVAQVKDEKQKPYANVVGVNEVMDFITQESNEHIIIPHGYLKKGENTIKLQFASPIATQGSAVTRYLDREDGSEYIYTLFVPSDASTAFPCFDQPDLKARFTLIVATPEIWNIISNAEIDEIPVANTMGDKYVRTHYHAFKQTEPISTYVFAFAAGDFAEFSEDGEMNLIPWNYRPAKVPPKAKSKELPMSIYVRKSKAERMKAEAQTIFKQNRECLKYFEKYFDYKFPFPKYDLVIIPEFAYGGMEHAGATFLREERILFPTDPTANDYLSRANLMFHEAAHQWFGDLVTMKWFDDLWLKEGFAEFMSYKAIEATMPEFNAWKAFYERNKPLAYLTDSTKGTTPIYQEIPNLNSAKSAYGNIVYRKAPSFLRQAEFYLGPDKFQKAIQSFVKRHAFKNAEWSDLVKTFEEASNQKLDEWANAWVKRRGMPAVTITEADRHVYAKLGGRHDTQTIIGLEQTDALGEGGIWPMRLKVLLIYENGRTETKDITLDKQSARVEAFWTLIANNPRGGAELPKLIFPNYEDYGYGRFLLDVNLKHYGRDIRLEHNREYAMAHIGEVKDDFFRAMLWGSLWDSVREAGELAPVDYVELVIKNVTQEKDEITIQTLLNRVGTAFGYYLSEKQKKEIAPRLEKLLKEKMLGANTLGQRITYYRAFLNVATTGEAREDLKKLLRGDLKINGMTMRARDKFDIITGLISRGDKDGPGLLDQLGKAETSDDARRYAYAAGAASGTAENKKKYFEDFTNNPNVAESWIEAAFITFNQARQSDLTLPYLEAALKELPKLKRSRKIFFVNGWLAAFIGGQKDERALKVVQQFLDEEKTLDRDLRLKVLEVVDGLERTVKIREKFKE